MPNLNPNSTNYRHTYEPNTNDNAVMRASLNWIEYK
jgi:hypothetical protein